MLIGEGFDGAFIDRSGCGKSKVGRSFGDVVREHLVNAIRCQFKIARYNDPKKESEPPGDQCFPLLLWPDHRQPLLSSLTHVLPQVDHKGGKVVLRTLVGTFREPVQRGLVLVLVCLHPVAVKTSEDVLRCPRREGER